MLDLVKVDESNLNIESQHNGLQYNRIEFINKMGTEVDANLLIDALEKVYDLNQFEICTIGYNSMITDLEWIRRLPNISSLDIYSENIKSMNGSEFLTKMLGIEIRVERNKALNVDACANVRMKKIIMTYLKGIYYGAIAQNKSIETLHLYKWPNFDCQSWMMQSLKHIIFASGKFETFGDSVVIPKLQRLDFNGCRKLTNFYGENPNITILELVNCKSLDMTTIKVFENLEYVMINASISLNISALTGLSKLRTLVIMNATVNFDVLEIGGILPMLKLFYYGKLKKEEQQVLSNLNPNINITTNLSLVF